MQVTEVEAFCRNVINNKEKHGDEKVPAVSIKLEAIRMSADVLDELFPREGVKFSEVMFIDSHATLQQMHPLTSSQELEPYIVTMNGVEMDHCKLKQIKVTPDEGNTVLVSLQVNTQLESNKWAAPLMKAKQEDVIVSIAPKQYDGGTNDD